MSFKPIKAVRKAVPIIMSISGTSGSGKTYSALLVAAGLAGPSGKVTLIDTENGRGAYYADSPGIVAALPGGFTIIPFEAPFSPARYIEAIDVAEKDGTTVLVIDSGSHEWEGYGSCSEIAEADKGRWNKAKLANRRYVYRLLYSSMHIIVCLRAREKSKIIPKTASASGKEEILSLGILPVAEKNFVFEMMLSLQLDEKTHHATPVKVPETMQTLFPGGQMLTRADGERIRKWNETGDVEDQSERLRARGRDAAQQGMASYKAFFESLSGPQRKMLADTVHAENKATAQRVDKERENEIPTFGTAEDHAAWPDSFDGPECFWNGDHFRFDESSSAYKKVA